MEHKTEQPEGPDELVTVDCLPITTVHYQRLISLGNFENERVGAHAIVEDHQTPEQALEALKNWVNSQLGRKKEAQELEQQIITRMSEKMILEAEVDRLREKYLKAKAFIEGLGLKLPPRYGPDDDMPF